jgi:adenylate cyclase
VAPAEIWQELKRRKVIRLVLLYLVVGWVVIQAADIIFPALDIPDWALSFVVVLVILGFPVAVALSWMFDVTSDGVRRAGRSTRRKHVQARDAAGAGERSIAVLPFVNMSDDRENEYFSDGMTEEILNALAKVRDLRVASRTSSFAFKGKEFDVRDIAERLGVETVLEGSVRKAGDRIRITAQLIDAGNGYHLWSHTYDREPEDVFEIQDQIARAIVDALKVQLGADQDAPLVERETRDMEAYNFYLKGRYFYNRDHEEDLRRSLDMYREALGRDPRFARAEAGMADTWMHLADDWVPPEEAYPEAKAAARRALWTIRSPRRTRPSATCSAGSTGPSTRRSWRSAVRWRPTRVTPTGTGAWPPSCPARAAWPKPWTPCGRR